MFAGARLSPTQYERLNDSIVELARQIGTLQSQYGSAASETPVAEATVWVLEFIRDGSAALLTVLGGGAPAALALGTAGAIGIGVAGELSESVVNGDEFEPGGIIFDGVVSGLIAALTARVSPALSRALAREVSAILRELAVSRQLRLVVCQQIVPRLTTLLVNRINASASSVVAGAASGQDEDHIAAAVAAQWSIRALVLDAVTTAVGTAGRRAAEGPACPARRSTSVAAVAPASCGISRTAPAATTNAWPSSPRSCATSQTVGRGGAVRASTTPPRRCRTSSGRCTRRAAGRAPTRARRRRGGPRRT